MKASRYLKELAKTQAREQAIDLSANSELKAVDGKPIKMRQLFFAQRANERLIKVNQEKV